MAQGHDVTLFASGDSLTSGELVPCSPRALRLDTSLRDPLAYQVLALEKLRERAAEFDIVHFHIDHMHFPMVRLLDLPSLTTLHGRQDIPDLLPLYRAFPDLPRVSISMAQRQPVPFVNWIGNVPHGLPLNLHAFKPQDNGEPREDAGYLAFLGRVCPEKGVDRAIRIARQAGLKLKIAAKVDDADRTYFERTIRPLLADDEVEFVGEINEQQKAGFLGQAVALLFPITWPEPFGLVMIEAMACGTPVIAFRHGSVPEVLEEGLTGVIVDDEEAAAQAVPRAAALDRSRIRKRFEERFGTKRMASDYVSIYEQILAGRGGQRAAEGTLDELLRVTAHVHQPAGVSS